MIEHSKHNAHKHDLMRIAIVCGIDKSTLERTNFETHQIRELVIQCITSIQRDNAKFRQLARRLHKSLEEAKQGDFLTVPVSKF